LSIFDIHTDFVHSVANALCLNQCFHFVIILKKNILLKISVTTHLDNKYLYKH